MEAVARFNAGSLRFLLRLPFLSAAPPAGSSPLQLCVAPPPKNDAVRSPLLVPPALVYSRRSARIREGEASNRLTMLGKASLRKKMKMEGTKGSAPSNDLLLPAEELLELAAEGVPPLSDKDVIQLAAACDVPGFDLNLVPSAQDV
ncbi:hypothetical protein D1007_01711 [Hordeum vulgare]|nr:hypothetical protein D1007_01711 [Hordeum vulgare]